MAKNTSDTLKLLNLQLAAIEAKITKLYGSTYAYAAQLAQVRAAVNKGEEFQWSKNPEAAKQIENRLTKLATTLDSYLGKATEASYKYGQASTENALTAALGGVDDGELKSIMDDAAAAMRKRGADGHTYYTQSRGGVTTSERVWSMNESVKLELEVAIQNAALEGTSADELAQTIQKYLKHPERLFRSVRVTDPETGEWTGEYRMSKAAQECHPGQGVYRSAYKNALRLARTELTQAYRRAEWESYQDNPLITGYRIELSNNHTTTITTSRGKKVVPLHDICDEMAGTQFPKTFLWTGWHPQCRCRMVPIIITHDDFKARVRARHQKKLDEWKPKEQTTEMPEAFNKWVEENKHRWQKKGASVPFFIRDNYKEGKVGNGLDLRIINDLEQARIAAEQAAGKSKTEPAKINREEEEEWLKKEFNLSDTSIERATDNGTYDLIFDFNIRRLNEKLGEIAKANGFDTNNKSVKVNSFGSIFITFESDARAEYINDRDGSTYTDSMFRLSRSMRRRDDGIEVGHELFIIAPAIQKKGISKKVFNYLYECYKSVGVRYISVHANINIGGYTWAKYGFYSTDRGQAEWALRHSKSNPHYNEAMKIIEDFYTGKPSSTPFPMKLIADKPWGRDILLGTDWLGEIDLHDSRQREIWETYLGLR